MANYLLKDLPLLSMFKVVNCSTVYTKLSYANAYTGNVACSFFPTNHYTCKLSSKRMHKQLNQYTEVVLLVPGNSSFKMEEK